jgi:formylglycine-generating enzyme required for sulfatase activity
MRYAMLVAVVALFSVSGLAQTTTVDIKCNGHEQGVFVPSGSNVKLTFDVTAGSGAGNTVDIWLVLKTPFGFFSYDGLGSYLGWNYGLGNVFFTGPLADFQDTALDSPLPNGAYVGHIALDTWADGILDLKCVYFSDQVDFRCESPSGMALIPAGYFMMGDHHDGMPDALPVHNVGIDAFWMDICEVTNLKYCEYLNSAYGQGLIEVINNVVFKAGDTESYCDTDTSSSYSQITWDGNRFDVVNGEEDHPMLQVSWYGAVAYSNWRSEKDGRTPCYNLETWDCHYGAGSYRLPSEAEWEKAARGSEHNPYYRYPWGDSIDGSMANYYTSGDPYEGVWPQTTPVGYYDGNQIPAGNDMANGYGLYDMAGNVFEWCDDKYDDDYYQYCVDNNIDYNPHGPVSGLHRVLRGGSWDGDTHFLRCALRNNNNPEHRSYYAGFRLVLD